MDQEDKNMLLSKMKHRQTVHEKKPGIDIGMKRIQMWNRKITNYVAEGSEASSNRY